MADEAYYGNPKILAQGQRARMGRELLDLGPTLDSAAHDLTHWPAVNLTQPVTPEMRDQALGNAFDLTTNFMGGGVGTVGKALGKALANRAEAFATHEAHIGPNTGHLPGSQNATQAEREAFAADPRSNWATGPGGTDAIYNGVADVLPSKPSQGIYQPPGKPLETNPGQVARVMVTETPKGRQMVRADRQMIEAGEAIRNYIGAQDAGAAHAHMLGAPATNSALARLDRPATLAELLRVKDVAGKHGLSEAFDSSRGITVTGFPPPKMSNPAALIEDLKAAVPDATPIQRTRVDPIYVDFVDKWKAGGGAATQELLSRISKQPELAAKFDANPLIPQQALAKLSRDSEWAAKWGAAREDIQNAQKIIGDGPGWIGRLTDAMKRGAVLPAVGAAVLSQVVQPEHE